MSEAIDLQPAALRAPSASEAIEARIDAISAGAITSARAGAAELLLLGEEVLEQWIKARGEQPTTELRDGFRVLALHRQGARGEPSFNACRETCRELVYRHNVILAGNLSDTQAEHTLRLMALVAKHLCLFVAGKMQVAGLGEFCCAAKPMRAGGQ